VEEGPNVADGYTTYAKELIRARLEQQTKWQCEDHGVVTTRHPGKLQSMRSTLPIIPRMPIRQSIRVTPQPSQTPRLDIRRQLGRGSPRCQGLILSMTRIAFHLLAMCVLAVTAGCHAIDFYTPSLQQAVPPEMEPPRELSMMSLPTYRIETPDVIFVSMTTLVPRSSYLISPSDELQVIVLGTLQERPIRSIYRVESDGTINLGMPYGMVRVAGITVEGAEEQITQTLRLVLKAPLVSVTLTRSAAPEQLTGRYVLMPDGTVNLGRYGMVHVTGRTVTEAAKAIETHLAQYFAAPQVGVTVVEYNSKHYYVIGSRGWESYLETSSHNLSLQWIQYLNGREVSRTPWRTVEESGWIAEGERRPARYSITGNETVLDAISQLSAHDQRRMSSKVIWIARPAVDGGGGEQILRVDWTAITRDGKTDTNYQILPGDRVFVVDDSMLAADATIGTLMSPITRLLSLTNLGMTSAKSAETLGRNFNKLRRN
jgi:polysaccharide biosynthesis/export protein